MQEHGSQNLSLVDAFGAFGEQLLSDFLHLRCGRRSQTEGVQTVHERRHVLALRLQLRLRWLRSGRGAAETTSVEEDRLAVDPAIPPSYLQADLLKLLGVDRPARPWLALRFGE